MVDRRHRRAGRAPASDSTTTSTTDLSKDDFDDDPDDPDDVDDGLFHDGGLVRLAGGAPLGWPIPLRGFWAKTRRTAASR